MSTSNVKRGRGRPRKNADTEEIDQAQSYDAETKQKPDKPDNRKPERGMDKQNKKNINAMFSKKLEEPPSKMFLYLQGSDTESEDGSDEEVRTDDNFNEHSNENANHANHVNHANRKTKSKQSIASISERLVESNVYDSDEDSVYTDGYDDEDANVDVDVDANADVDVDADVDAYADTDADDIITPIDYASFNTKDHDVLLLLKHIRRRDAIISKLSTETSGSRRRAIKVNPLHSIRGIAKNSNIEYHCTIKHVDTDKHIVQQPTDLHCWWCDYSFSNIPVYIPQMYRNDVFYVFGNFCSFNCALRYNSELTDPKVRTRKVLLLNMKDKVLGPAVEIKPADRRELLQSKGGPLSIEEFREGFLPSTKSIDMDMPPMIPMTHVVKYN